MDPMRMERPKYPQFEFLPHSNLKPKVLRLARSNETQFGQRENNGSP
jgi:hypothetical protein